MSAVRGRVWLTSAVLIIIGLSLAVLAPASASAGLRVDRVSSATATGLLSPLPTAAASTVTSLPLSPSPVAPSPAHRTPRMLASTGLDITVPVVVGLIVLVVGIMLVGWAFLATGRRVPDSGRRR